MKITKRRVTKRKRIKRKYSRKRTKTRHSRKRVFSKKRRKTNKKKKGGGGFFDLLPNRKKKIEAAKEKEAKEKEAKIDELNIKKEKISKVFDEMKKELKKKYLAEENKGQQCYTDYINNFIRTNFKEKKEAKQIIEIIKNFNYMKNLTQTLFKIKFLKNKIKNNQSENNQSGGYNQNTYNPKLNTETKENNKTEQQLEAEYNETFDDIKKKIVRSIEAEIK